MPRFAKSVGRVLYFLRMQDKLEEWHVIETLLPEGWVEKAREFVERGGEVYS